MDLAKIRRIIISAVVSDDALFETLVLKGGNALNLIHGIGSRVSLDLDFSMSQDFKDIENTKKRLFAALIEHLDANNYVVFDEKLTRKPAKTKDPTWGGYVVEFKLIDRKKHDELNGNLDEIRRNSVTVDGIGSGPRTFRIEISKYEYCEEKIEVEVEYYSCYVYTLPMLAAEKLRAICQQMPEYALNKTKVARARDFYDVHSIIESQHLDLSEARYLELINNVFAAKKVPLHLLGKISKTRQFHEAEWAGVRDSIAGGQEDFGFYFESVVKTVGELESLWVE